ncbi:MAG: hypothetical protein QOH49_408 [Acidobacteriota bacterium]|jgi:hypothetical protein|nr:hypothetical protein [Acidobacteriota bacterium]
MKEQVNFGHGVACRTAAVLLALLLLAVAGCSTGVEVRPQEEEEMVDTGNEPGVEHVPSADEVSPETARLPTPPPKPKVTDAASGTVADAGEFVPFYEPPRHLSQYGWLERDFKSARVLENIAERLNSELALKSNVTLSFRECGVVNAMYEPDKHRVSMCYEYVSFFQNLFVQSGGSAEAAASGIKGAVHYTLYHEIGHALIHTLDLPVTGREEDVVDQLSTYLLVEQGGEEGEEMALSGAYFWYLLAQRNRQVGVGQTYWDEHSTSEQRFFNSICWLYGSNPQKYRGLVNSVLPTERAERCPNEYRRFVKGWRNALSPFIKH